MGGRVRRMDEVGGHGKCDTSLIREWQSGASANLFLAPLVRGDSPQCWEMSLCDKGGGLLSGAVCEAD